MAKRLDGQTAVRYIVIKEDYMTAQAISINGGVYV